MSLRLNIVNEADGMLHLIIDILSLFSNFFTGITKPRYCPIQSDLDLNTIVY